MLIHTVWVRRDAAPSAPDLLHAWDQNQIDTDRAGWCALIRDAALEDDVAAVAEIRIEVDTAAILRALTPDPITIPGTIQTRGRPA